MRRHFQSPLARWGFTVCAAVAALTAQPGPFLVTTVLAVYAWRVRRRPLTRSRRSPVQHTHVIAVVVIGIAALASAGVACLIDSARRSSRAARSDRRTH